MGARSKERFIAESGQATVEFVAVLPFILLLGLLLWQLAIAGQAVWLSGSAARAAARASAVGADPLDAARSTLPKRLEQGLKVSDEGEGTVRVSVPIPSLVGKRLMSYDARARFAPQDE